VMRSIAGFHSVIRPWGETTKIPSEACSITSATGGGEEARARRSSISFIRSPWPCGQFDSAWRHGECRELGGRSSSAVGPQTVSAAARRTHSSNGLDGWSKRARQRCATNAGGSRIPGPAGALGTLPAIMGGTLDPEDAIRTLDAELERGRRLLAEAATVQELEQGEVALLGRKAPFSEVQRSLRTLPEETRRRVGARTNQVR